MAKLAELLAAAERADRDPRRQPLVARGCDRRRALCGALRAAGRARAIRRLPLFDPLHPCYAGDLGIGPNPKLVARIKAADLVVLLVGGRLGEIAVAGLHAVRHSAAADALRACASGRRGARPRLHVRIWRSMPRRPRSPRRWTRCSRPRASRWRDETNAAHADYLAWTETPTEQPGGVNLGAVMVWLRENLPADAILCNGAGNYAAWIHRFYRFRRFATHIAPASALHGLRRAGGGGDEAALSPSAR